MGRHRKPWEPCPSMPHEGPPVQCEDGVRCGACGLRLDPLLVLVPTPEVRVAAQG